MAFRLIQNHCQYKQDIRDVALFNYDWEDLDDVHTHSKPFTRCLDLSKDRVPEYTPNCQGQCGTPNRGSSTLRVMIVCTGYVL